MAGEERTKGHHARSEGPFIPDHITDRDLHPEVRAQLRPIPKGTAEKVGKHLVLAGELLESDPELAYSHAQAAVRHAGRIDVVREAAALTAYACGKYAEALREFRTVRRLSGIDAHRAAEADCQRGLGRPERALSVLQEAPKDVSPAYRAEMALVEAGARCDLGQQEMALIVLEEAPRTAETAPRLDEARADILEELGQKQRAEEIRARLVEDDYDLIDYEDLDPRYGYEEQGLTDNDTSNE